MKVWTYNDYDDYVDWQVKTNKAKERVVWVDETTIATICKGIREVPEAILCHGTRNGKELQYFKEYFPNAFILGTEISDTATKYDMTVQHDFNKPKEEWIERFDILYSNSFDHAYEPYATMDIWSNQLKKEGLLFFEYCHDPSDNVSRPEDPVELNVSDIMDLFRKSKLKYLTEFDTIGFKKRRTSKVFVAQRV